MRRSSSARAAHVREQLPHVRQAGAQLGVADLDGHHRVLKLGEVRVGLRDGVDRVRDEALHARRRHPARRRLERARGQAEALSEPGVRALRLPVRHLHRAEELLLESVGRALVELLVRLAERGQRHAELVDRVGDRVEQLLSRFGGDVGHAGEATLRAWTTSSTARWPRTSATAI